MGADLHKKFDLQNVSTTQGLAVDPREIIVDFSRRGRKFPPTKEEIIDLAQKMARDGQEEEVKYQKTPDKKIKLIFGFTRYEASMWLVENGHPNFRLRGSVVECNDKEAIQHNIAENRDRKQTSVIDDAHNQRQLRELCGMSDADIAKDYKVTVAWVTQIRDLLLYDEDIQLLIHNKKFPVSAAMALMSKTPEDVRKKIITEATDGDGRVRGPKVTELLRDYLIEKNQANENDNSEEINDEEDDDAELGEAFAAQLQAATTGALPIEGAAASVSGAVEESGEEAGEQPAGPKKKKGPGREKKDSVARSVKDLRRFLTDFLEESDDPAMREFLKKTSAWVEGKGTDQQFKNAHLKLLKATPMPPQPKEAAAENKEPETAGAA